MKRMLFLIAALGLAALGCSKEAPLQPTVEPSLSVKPTLSKVETTEYQYFLGEEGDPVVSEASTGDRVEIVGEGTFSVHPKSTITGGGEFVHKDGSGNVLESGNWTATQLISFHSYGSASIQGLPAEWEGGLALIRVQLSSGSDGILKVDCRLGDFPAASTEGASFVIQDAVNFNKRIGGGTLFIRTSP